MKSEKISSKELFNAIDQIYQEKGITSEYLIDSLKSALKIAYKRDFINTYSADEREERKNKLVAYGSEEYSKEELVAELGSASLMNIVGIENNHSFKNSTAYIQSWVRVLQNDVKFIVSASSKAEKAVKYILNEA